MKLRENLSKYFTPPPKKKVKFIFSPFHGISKRGGGWQFFFENSSTYIYTGRLKFQPHSIKMWILEPIQFRVADSKKPIFENLTKEKSRVLFFQDQPKFIGMSDWPQFFFKMTMMDIGSKSVINRTWSQFKMATIYVSGLDANFYSPLKSGMRYVSACGNYRELACQKHRELACQCPLLLASYLTTVYAWQLIMIWGF